MIQIRGISLPPLHAQTALAREAARLLRIAPADVREVRIVRRSVDARKKPDIRFVYTIEAAVSGDEAAVLRRSRCRSACIAPVGGYLPPQPLARCAERPVVVGFGPAGMFAALVLALAGLRPIVLERGDSVEARQAAVARFFASGVLDAQSNIQFGEGGAGTFSDGKLHTGVNNPRSRWILEQFVAAGAREDILYDAKPHVGTDVLCEVVKNLRNRILALGGEVRFRTQLTSILQKDARVTAAVTQEGEVIGCGAIILAIGHSARDTFEALNSAGIPMEAKPFAMGVRIEHLQSRINRTQYGADNPCLPPADYKLVRHIGGETVYTFCMCPGGFVVGAASETGGVVTNGMSNADRDGKNANAALLVALSPADFPGSGALSGMYWQRSIERAAYAAGGGGYRAPAQRVGDFLRGAASAAAGSVVPTYRPGVTWTDLHGVLPGKITCALEQALPLLDGCFAGFADPDAVLTAPETRSSSPVRILRDAMRQSTLRGLYPVGEGAGYAGGIMSAAIDGMLSAEALIEALRAQEA